MMERLLKVLVVAVLVFGVWIISDIILDINTTATMEYVENQPKPYLSKDPNSGDWICSKHGNLSPKADYQIVIIAQTITMADVTYCNDCVFETVVIILNQYITGVEE